MMFSFQLYTKDMSAEGDWTAEEFNYKGSMIMARCFDAIRSMLRQSRLVVFPSRSFCIVRDTSPEYVQKDLAEGYMQIMNTNPKIKISLITMRFRSKFESEVAVALGRMGISWEFEPDKIPYQPEPKVYIPDFYIPRNDIYIEVKGRLTQQDE